jgi:hypothetical protein
MKLKILNKHNSKTCRNKYELNKLSLCQDGPKMTCIARKCSECETKKLEGHFSSIANPIEIVSWYQWESKENEGTKTKYKKITCAEVDLFENTRERNDERCG